MGKGCQHELRDYRRVEFSNGTKHIAIRCAGCGKHLGFAPKAGIDLDKLVEETTERRRREQLGMPTGCRACGAEKAKLSGCCHSCERAGKHKELRRYAKSLGLTVWDLSKEQLFDLWEKKSA